MKKHLKNFPILIFLFLFQLQGMGQSTECATDYIHTNLMQIDSIYRKQIHLLESQVEASIQNHKHSKSKSTIYTIPVVVHVLHLGESIGTGSNISDIQIQQAIIGLNNRFRNINGCGNAEILFSHSSVISDPHNKSRG